MELDSKAVSDRNTAEKVQEGSCVLETKINLGGIGTGCAIRQ